MEPVRVLLVDDSPVMRRYLAETIGHASGFEVVGTAHNAADAWQKIQSEGPNVITLDVEMPNMDGITFLERLMQLRPMPVVMVSALTQSGAQATLRALQLGAADFVGKPLGSKHQPDTQWVDELLLKLRRAARLRPTRLAPGRSHDQYPAVSAPASLVRTARKCEARLIAIGTGSGGTNGLCNMLLGFPRDCPAVVVAAHLAAIVARALVSRLSKESSVQFRLAANNDKLVRGHIWVAPGGMHIGVARVGQDLRIRLHPGDPIRGCSPSIDLLFESAAKQVGADTIGVLLESAGDDGVFGLRLLESSGAKTIREVQAIQPEFVQINEDASLMKALSNGRSANTREATLPEIPDLLFGARAALG